MGKGRKSSAGGSEEEVRDAARTTAPPERIEGATNALRRTLIGREASPQLRIFARVARQQLLVSRCEYNSCILERSDSAQMADNEEIGRALAMTPIETTPTTDDIQTPAPKI